MADGAVAVAPRRRAFGARDPDHFEAIEIDETALRRAAFLAEERAGRAGPAEAAARAPVDVAMPTDRSLNTAWIVWLLTGLAGGHRFYLRRPLSGGIQAVLFAGSWAAALLGAFEAFAGVALSCLWMGIDGVLLPRLHRSSAPR
jgi:TM2 domain-containing membrane protein YozV